MSAAVQDRVVPWALHVARVGHCLEVGQAEDVFPRHNECFQSLNFTPAF